MLFGTNCAKKKCTFHSELTHDGMLLFSCHSHDRGLNKCIDKRNTKERDLAFARTHVVAIRVSNS